MDLLKFEGAHSHQWLCSIHGSENVFQVHVILKIEIVAVVLACTVSMIDHYI